MNIICINLITTLPLSWGFPVMILLNTNKYKIITKAPKFKNFIFILLDSNIIQLKVNIT